MVYLSRMHPVFSPLPWTRRTNVYEVNLRQYTQEGDLKSFQAHLPRLRDMGVETLWFMPVTPISRLNRKGSLGSYYACSDYTSVNPEYGTLDDFRSVVGEAHALGMKVIIDWVANHTGWDHRWTLEQPDYYKRNHEGDFYDAHGWDDVIDLDYGNPRLREAMVDSMRFWVETCDIDGFRCDMAMLTPADFWREARSKLDTVKPLFWLAELDPWDHEAYMQVFDAAYTWRWMHAARHYFQQHEAHRDTAHLRQVLDHYSGLHPASMLPAWFTANHDENSWNGTEYEKYGPMALPLAVFACTWKGMPLLYSGQELPNHKRLAFFDRDPIQWDRQPELHGFYQKLFSIRDMHPAIPEGGVEWAATSHDDRLLAYLRRSGDRTLLVILNLRDYPTGPVTIRHEGPPETLTEMFTGMVSPSGAWPQTTLGPWGYQVWMG
jgi:alpha-amylase